MQNDDDTLPSIISAGRGILVKMLVTLKRHVIRVFSIIFFMLILDTGII